MPPCRLRTISVLVPYRSGGGPAVVTYWMYPLAQEAGAHNPLRPNLGETGYRRPKSMHPSIAEQIGSMHDQELLDSSRHLPRLPVKHRRAKTVRRLLRTLSRGKRRARGQELESRSLTLP